MCEVTSLSQKKIRDALAEAERERINAQEALERLAEEAIKARPILSIRDHIRVPYIMIEYDDQT